VEPSLSKERGVLEISMPVLISQNVNILLLFLPKEPGLNAPSAKKGKSLRKEIRGDRFSTPALITLNVNLLFQASRREKNALFANLCSSKIKGER